MSAADDCVAIARETIASEQPDYEPLGGDRFIDLPTVLSVRELAAHLRVGEHIVRDLINSGRLARLDYTRPVRVARAELLRFLEEASVRGKL